MIMQSSHFKRATCFPFRNRFPTSQSRITRKCSGREKMSGVGEFWSQGSLQMYLGLNSIKVIFWEASHTDLNYLCILQSLQIHSMQCCRDLCSWGCSIFRCYESWRVLLWGGQGDQGDDWHDSRRICSIFRSTLGISGGLRLSGKSSIPLLHH